MAGPGPALSPPWEVVQKVVSLTNVPAERSLESKFGDVMIPSSGETAWDIAVASCILEDGVLLGGDMNVLRPSHETDGIFLAYYLSNGSKRNIARLAQGNSVVHLYSSYLRGLKLLVPTLREQKKIADFLGTIDEWIENLKAQKREWEAYKKGMMQKIFSQEIRFKDEDGNEFPDWEEKKLGEVLKIGSGKDYKHLGSGAVPVFGTGGYMLSVDRSLGDEATVFIGRKGTINKPFYHKGPFWTVDTLFFTHNYKNTTAEFVYLLFQQINWLKYNEASGVPSLSKITIEKIKVKTPNMEEQKKIAEFLGSVDTWIANLKEQSREWEAYKKGMMQKIFSQEIRFRDENGNEFPDWEEKKLGEVYSFLRTNSLSRDQLNYESGDARNIHYGDIHTKFRSHFYFDEENVPFVNFGEEPNNFNADFIECGDLILADASEDYADIGKSIEICGLEDQKILSGLHTLLLRRKGDEVVSGFMGHFLRSPAFRLAMQRVAQGTKVLSISKTHLQKLKLNLPNKVEQKKIAGFLSSVDDLICSHQEKITHAEEWKKGLMQRMFV